MLVNDTIIRDSLTNKSQRRRCSLVTTDKIAFSNDNHENSNQIEDNQRKSYIRSLSLARDESTEPIFRFSDSVLQTIHDNTNNDE